VRVLSPEGTWEKHATFKGIPSGLAMPFNFTFALFDHENQLLPWRKSHPARIISVSMDGVVSENTMGVFNSSGIGEIKNLILTGAPGTSVSSFRIETE